MKTKDFDYYLPEELIAQTPLEKRDESRLMCLETLPQYSHYDHADTSYHDHGFHDFHLT